MIVSCYQTKNAKSNKIYICSNDIFLKVLKIRVLSYFYLLNSAASLSLHFFHILLLRILVQFFLLHNHWLLLDMSLVEVSLHGHVGAPEHLTKPFFVIGPMQHRGLFVFAI